MDVKRIISESGGHLRGFEAVMKNLSELDAEMLTAAQLRYTQIFEFWRLICNKENYADVDRTIAIISDLFSDQTKKAEIRCNNEEVLLAQYLLAGSRTSELLDKVLICVMASEALLKTEYFSYEDILGYFDDIDAKVKGRIACVRSEYIENAYSKLSLAVESPRVSYFSSYEDAAEAVYNGMTEYCILPIYNDVDGRLRGFYSLISKYELKIFAVCDQISKGNEAIRSTQYALLKRGLDISKDSERLEVLLNSVSVIKIAEAIEFAEALNIHTLRADAGVDGVFSLVVDIKDREILPFLLYLAASFPSFTPVGIYSHII